MSDTKYILKKRDMNTLTYIILQQNQSHDDLRIHESLLHINVYQVVTDVLHWKLRSHQITPFILLFFCFCENCDQKKEVEKK